MTKWDPKLDRVVLSQAWRAADDDLPPGPKPQATPPVRHFWLGHEDARTTQADTVPS